MNLILLRNQYPFAIVKKVDRKKYIDALDAVTGKGDFQPFLLFIARCVEQSLDIYLNRQKLKKFLPLSQACKRHIILFRVSQSASQTRSARCSQDREELDEYPERP